MSPRWWIFALVLLTGCGRWTGAAKSRREVLREGLMSERMRADVRTSLAGTPVVLDCRVGPSLEQSCQAEAGGVWFKVEDSDDGGRIIVPPDTSEQRIASFWRRLAPESFTAFSKTVEDRALERMAAEDAAFAARWGLVAGIESGFSTIGAAGGSTDIMGHVGVRRWFTANYGGQAALDVSYRQGATQLAAQFGLRLGVELTRFTEGRFLGKIGAPPFSLTLYTGPKLAIPGPIPGIRTGLSFRLSDWYMAPVVIELYADTFFTDPPKAVEYGFALGIGI